MATNKKERREKLLALLNVDPFLTDYQLAERLQVSVATIRLDRMALGVPELRERMKDLAARNHTKLRSLEGYEVIGELVDLAIGSYGISLLSVNSDMTFKRTDILRGHHLFAQANSLAVALVDAPIALTASAHVKFIRPVKSSERVVAKAELIQKAGTRHTISVASRVDQELVFQGEFIVVAIDHKGSDSD